MHIVIDARMIGERPHGIARHTWSLIHQLEKLDRKNRYTLLVNNDFLKGKTRFTLRRMASPWISLREQVELPLVLKKLKADIFHSPSFIIPFFCPVPFVITIHDLNHIAFKEGQRLHYTLYYKTILKKALQRAKKIIAVSEFTKRELLSYYTLNPSKISVIHNGVEPHFSPIKDRRRLLPLSKKYGLPDRFILFVGNDKKHKNLDRLLAAYMAADVHIPLVIVGIRAASDDPNIRFIHFIPESELHYLYNLSTLVVFPSLYEGFGLPALEALACGKPLITSNTTSLPEVVGKAAIQIDPTNTVALSTALTQALSGKYQKKRNDAGIRRSKLFSWKTAAQKTWEIYESCARS